MNTAAGAPSKRTMTYVAIAWALFSMSAIVGALLFVDMGAPSLAALAWIVAQLIALAWSAAHLGRTDAQARGF